MRAGVFLLLFGAMSAAAEPAVVKVGVYLRNIDSIDFETNTYQLDFDFWMHWSVPLDPPPTETFRFINATDIWALAIQPFYLDAEGRGQPRTLADGSFYQRFRVEGTFYHKFWLGTYPLDWQKFTVNVEDRQRPRAALIYKPDRENSGVFQDLQVPGWAVRDTENEERIFEADTSYGDPDRALPYSVSRYRFGVRLYRPARFFVLRLLPPLLLVYLTSALVFFLPTHAVDSRLAVVSTGILSEIFLQLSYSQDLPSISISTITDSIYNLCYALLVFGFAICVVGGRMFDTEEKLRQRLATEGLEGAEVAGLQAELTRREKRLRRLNTWTAITMIVLQLAGSIVILVWMRGTKDLIW